MPYTSDSNYTITQEGDDSDILALPVPDNSEITERPVSNAGDIKHYSLDLRKTKLNITGNVEWTLSRKESLVILMDGENLVIGDNAALLGGELSIASGGSLKIKGYSEVINGKNHYWKNVSIYFPRPSIKAFRQDEGALTNNGSLEIESAKIITANPVKFNGILNKLKGVDLLNYNTVGANGKTAIETRCLQTVDFEDVETDTTISIFNDDNILKGMVFVKSQFKIINKAANLNDGNKRPIEFIGFASLDSEGSIGGSPQVSMKNTEDGSEFLYKGIFLNLAVSKTEQQVKFKAKDISSNIIGEVKWYFTETDDGKSPISAYTWDRELTKEIDGVTTTVAGFRLYESNLNAIRKLVMAGDIVTGETPIETILTRLFWKNSSSYVYNSADSSTDDYINVTAEDPVYDPNQTEGFKDNYRLSGGAADTQVFYFRKYGFLFGSQTVLLRKNNSEVFAESTLNSNPNLVKTKAEVSALNQLTNLSDLYDYNQYLEWTDDSYAELEGYSTEMITIEGKSLVVNSNWNVEFIQNSNAIPITYNIATKTLTFYVSSTFEPSAKFDYLKIGKDLTKASAITLNFLYEYVENTDDNNTPNVLIEAHRIISSIVGGTNSFYDIKILGIKSGVADFEIYDKRISGSLNTIIEIARANFESIEILTTGAEVIKNTKSYAIADFLKTTTFPVSVYVNPEVSWRDNFDSGNTKITLVDVSGVKKFDLQCTNPLANISFLHVYYMARRAVKDYDETLNLKDYVEDISGFIEFKVPLINLNELSFNDNSHFGIRLVESDKGYLTSHDFKTSAEAGNNKTFTFTGIQNEDIIRYKTTDDAAITKVDVADIQTTLVLDKTKTYEVQFSRLGKKKSIITIDTNSTSLSPNYNDFFGFALQDSADLLSETFFEVYNNGIAVIKDTIIEANDFTNNEQRDIDLLLQWDHFYSPFGVNSLPILQLKQNSIVDLNYDIVAKQSDYNSPTEIVKMAQQYRYNGSKVDERITSLQRSSVTATIESGIEEFGFTKTTDNLTDKIKYNTTVIEKLEKEL